MGIYQSHNYFSSPSGNLSDVANTYFDLLSENSFSVTARQAHVLTETTYVTRRETGSLCKFQNKNRVKNA